MGSGASEDSSLPLPPPADQSPPISSFHRTVESDRVAVAAEVDTDKATRSRNTKLQKKVSFSDITAVATFSTVDNVNVKAQTKMPPKRQIGRTVSVMNATEKSFMEARHPELKDTFKMFERCSKFVRAREKRSESFYQELYSLLNKSIIKQFDKFKEEEQRQVMGNKLVDHVFVPAAVEYYKSVIDELDLTEVTNALVEEGKTSNEYGIRLIMAFREIFWNFSDENGYFAKELSETALFTYLSDDLKAIKDDEFEELMVIDDLFAYSSAVGVLHNCARMSEHVDRDSFRKANISQRLLPFKDCRQMYVKMITVLALAHIVDEGESDQLGMDDSKVFEFLFKEIRTALDSADQKSNGFSVSELVDGLTSLAKPDRNKKHIMSMKPLPTIGKLLKSQFVKTNLAAVGLVWELCFNPECKDVINNDSEILRLIKAMRTNGDAELAKAADSALFCMKKEKKEPKPEPTSKRKHIMISYQWSDQKQILKLKDNLVDLGHSVWIDVDNMGNYLLQGMAEAVEGAFLVLLCYSEKYKLSKNCRLEADYIFTTGKPFLPLKMQTGYTPDGWLGILIGSKLFYEFSGKYPYEQKFEEMEKVIRGHQSKPSNPPPNVPSLPPVPTPEPRRPTTPQVPANLYEKWTTEQVVQWLRTKNVEAGRLKKLKMLSGRQLVFLAKVYRQAPEAFYRFLETKLDVSSLEDIMNLTNAIAGLNI